MTGSCAGLFAFAFAFALCCLFCFVILAVDKKRFGLDIDGNKNNLNALKRRLRAHAMLSGEHTTKGNNKLPGCDLSFSEHKILLEVLKNIEAKNGILAAISALVFTVLVSTIAVIDAEFFCLAESNIATSENNLFLRGRKIFLGLILGMGFAIVISLIVVLGHISNSQYLKLHKMHARDYFLAAAMQKDLMRDLLLKEFRFRTREMGIVNCFGFVFSFSCFCFLVIFSIFMKYSFWLP